MGGGPTVGKRTPARPRTDRASDRWVAQPCLVDRAIRLRGQPVGSLFNGSVDRPTP